jgi:XisI protein
MDKITHYQNVIINFLENYNQDSGGNNLEDSVQRRIIADRLNNSFQLLSVGWRGSHYIFGPIFH